MWKNILKAPITIGRTKIGMKPMPEEEDECNKQLKKYADKLSKMNQQLKVNGEFLPLDDTSGQFSDAAQRLYYKEFPTMKKSAVEVIEVAYTPVPENVACKALEMLKAYKVDGQTLDGYVIHVGTGKILSSGLTYGDLFKKLRLVIREGEGSNKLVVLEHFIRIFSSISDTNFDDIDVDWRK
jgi:hypothetical protein